MPVRAASAARGQRQDIREHLSRHGDLVLKS
jgi:hypothetical protein